MATLPLITEASGLVQVSVGMGHGSAILDVNTASGESGLTDSTVVRLGLARDHVPYHEFVVVAGTRVKELATADAIEFDRFKAPGAKFMILPDLAARADSSGVLGADILHNYDVEFDFAGNKLSLYRSGQCAGALAGSTSVRLDVNSRGLATDAELDGKPLTASITTGLAISNLTLEAAERKFGFTEKTAGLKALATRNGYTTVMSYPFKTLDIQGVSVADPDIQIRNDLGRDLVIGMSVLRRLHFCIAYDDSKMYVTH